MIKIKEVMSNLLFSEFFCMFSFQFSMTPVQIHSSHSSSQMKGEMKSEVKREERDEVMKKILV